jgi:hypothetical protein
VGKEKRKRRNQKMNRDKTDYTGKMEFSAFVAALERQLQERYPDCEVKVCPVEKNNGVQLTAIHILQKGHTLTPSIYLEECYRQYLDGRSLEETLSAVAGLYEEQKLPGEVPLPALEDFEAVQDILCCRLINWEKNRERLQEMPHRQFLDCAVTYDIPVTLSEGREGRITVTETLRRLWHVDEDTLYRHGMENTRRLMPVKLQPVGELIGDILSARRKDRESEGAWQEAEEVPDIPLYVLRCESGSQTSAAALLYREVLQEFAKKHGDFYILPSSVFEVLLAPVAGLPADAASLCGMVQEVNRTQVLPEEVLSDCAYRYHGATGEIEILT